MIQKYRRNWSEPAYRVATIAAIMASDATAEGLGVKYIYAAIDLLDASEDIMDEFRKTEPPHEPV